MEKAVKVAPEEIEKISYFLVVSCFLNVGTIGLAKASC